MTQFIYSPVATEKSMLLMEKENKLTFVIDRKASRNQIKKEVEERFDVKVVSVNILVSKRGKKAIVSLAEGYSAEDVGGRIGIF
ncbi:MAG: 50S ribosomal protein L23 [Candidatus Thermoplasmatota archaeon]|jgi:large subunit ribosomal protein L23|nr:50S ribosomal protein L23 [Candidatus Thermoplasmatota archaeon]